MDKRGIHNQSQAAFALFDDSRGYDVLIVCRRRVIAILEKCLEIFFSGGDITERWGALDQDAMEIGPDVSIYDGF